MRRNAPRLPRFAAALLAFLAGCAAAPSLSLQARREIFADAWSTIGEKHFDPKMGGVDWQAVRATYAPKVDAAHDERELAAVLQAMVGELHHSHVAVFPPSLVPSDEPNEPHGSGRTAGTAGLRVGWLDDDVVVTGLDPEGGAAKAGIHLGEALRAIDGRDLGAALASARHRGGTHWAGYLPYVMAAMLHGAPGTTITLQLASPGAPTHELLVTRESPAMEPMQLGNLGSLDAEFESRMLADNVLYVRFTPCFVPLQERFEQALLAHPDASGVILDVRDNPGGLGSLAMGIARHFVDTEVDLGAMRMRGAEGPLQFKVNPSESPFTGPLVVIVNRSTGSTAEILGASLQKIGRARIVGQTSMGAALPSVIERIAHGWRVQAVVADFTLPDGTSVEGTGVVPDVVVAATRADYLAGHDPFLDTALRELANAPRLVATTRRSPTAAQTARVAHAPCAMNAEMRALFERITADPSAQKLAAARSLRLTSSMELMGIKGPSITTIVPPGQAHSIASLPGVGEMLQVLNGQQAWSRNAVEGLRQLTGEELIVFQRTARLDPQSWLEQFASMEIVERVHDADHDGIVVRQTPHEGEGAPILLKLDAKTLLPYHSETTVHSRMGPMSVTTDMLEYGTFAGIVMPKRSVSRVGGATLTSVLESVELDVAVDPAIFDKPAPPAPKPVAKPKKTP
jgi:carboxyl-terminal processing protease